MSPLARNAIFAAFALIHSSAWAQQPAAASSAPPPATVASMTPSNAPAPVPVDPSAVGIDEDARALAALRRETGQQSEELKLLNFQVQVNDAKKKLGGISSGTSDIPELVGLDGVRGHYKAEFLSGNAILTATEGQWVTADWRVDRILPNGVQLSKKGGKETHTILFGNQPVQGGAQLLNQPSTGPQPPLQYQSPSSFNPGSGH